MRSRGAVRAPRSCPLTQLLAEQSARAEDEDQDEDREDGHLGPARIAERGREDLDEGDHEPANRGPGRVPDPAQYGGRERLEAGEEPQVELGTPEVEALD